jgi:hypothetical protein
MVQFDKKQLSVFTKKLRSALENKSVFVPNDVNDTDEESVATLKLQPGWVTALFLMSELLSMRVQINGDGSSTPADVWNLLEEAEGFLKIAGR